METTKRTTVKEFAACQGVSTLEANSFLAFLKQKGIAKIVGQVLPEGIKKGRASNVFEVPVTVTINM